MIATAFVVLCIVSYVSAGALQQQHDGFILHDIDGEQHLGYGVVPLFLGERIKLQFEEVELDAESSTNSDLWWLPQRNCDDVKVEIYSSGYVRTRRDLMRTLCDVDALKEFEAESSRGFYIALTTSRNVHGGHLRAKFSSDRGIKVTHTIFY